MPPIQNCLTLFESGQSPIYGLTIMRAQHIEPYDFTRPIFQHIPYRHEIPQALAHLLAFDLEKAVVHPVIRHHRRMEGGARLRDLVLVMGEYEVDAAGVDVEF